MAKVFHRERAGAPMQPFFDWWEVNGPFALTVPESGGNRTDAMQLVEWSKGRRLKPGHDPKVQASWEVVNETQVVTAAFTAEDSAHGHGAGADVFAVRTFFANGMPASVWLGNEKDPAERAEAQRLQKIVVDKARDFGLEVGADWKKPDVPHLQDKNWRTLPRFV